MTDRLTQPRDPLSRLHRHVQNWANNSNTKSLRTDTLMFHTARRDQMAMKLPSKVFHRLCLFFGRDAESVVCFRSVLPPKFSESFAENITIQPDFSSALGEPSVAANDFLRCERPIVN